MLQCSQYIKANKFITFKWISITSVALGGQLLYASSVSAADLITELARGLNTRPEYLSLNLPPRPGALPGAIFSYDMRLQIAGESSDDSLLRRGDPTNVEVTTHVNLAAGIRAGWAALFGVAADANDSATVSMLFQDVVIIEMRLEDLQRKANGSLAAGVAARQGRIPQIVYKAYEAVPTLTLIRSANASAESWARVRNTPLDTSITIGADTGDRIVYKTMGRVVFAFEVMQASFLSSN
jgi:hypothetical protein